MKLLALILVSAALIMAAMAGLVASDFLNLDLEELKDKYATEDSRFMELDGVRVHYMDQGDGPPVVLMHASFMNLRTWDALAAELAKRHRVIRMDFLTAGLTGSEPNDNYSFDRNGELIMLLTRALDVDRFALVATSSGGIVGFNFAARYPEQVERLVLINSAGLPRSARTNPNRLRGTALGRWFTARYRTKEMMRENLDNNFIEPHEPPEWLVQMNYDMARRKGRRREGAIADAETSVPAIRKQCCQPYKAPTMILWGINNQTVVHLEARRIRALVNQRPDPENKISGGRALSLYGNSRRSKSGYRCFPRRRTRGRPQNSATCPGTERGRNTLKEGSHARQHQSPVLSCWHKSYIDCRHGNRHSLRRP